jgi:HTH-type transcriptional regulator/antitoxin HipB
MLIPSPKELALLVVAQRRKLKLSQAAVGKLVGLKQQTISDFENRPEGTKISTLFFILSAVDLQLELTSKEPSPPQSNAWKEEW